jgi:hypothetical protein
MAELTKVNPIMSATRGRAFTGKTLNKFTVDVVENSTNLATANMGPGGAFQAILQVISTMGTIVGHSALRSDGSNDGQVFDVLIEGEFGTDTYDGTNSETFAAHLEDLVQGLGTVNSVVLTSATVTAATGYPMYANEA